VSNSTKKTKAALAKKKPEVAVPEGDRHQNSAQEASEAGSVDKIRDIIFGNQMRDYETRFVRLEQRLLKEISDLRDETGKRFDSFELYVNKELESLGARLKTEQDLRAELDKKLSGEIKDASRSLTKNIDRLAEVQSNDSRELRQQLLELNKNISAEIRKKGEESTQALDQTAEELRAGKVDRSALAEILMEIAVRMSDELAEKSSLETENIKDE
jgi:exonuclease VII large subunit